MSRDDVTLLDILNACRRVVEFLVGQDRSAFLRDRKTQSAVLHQLLLIGEATKRLSDDFRNRHKQIQWKAIAGLRDRLIHAYDRVDLADVWTTRRKEVPDLIAFLEPLTPTPPNPDA
jgi:uncharacterized protein with HEPN domain